MKAIGDWVLIEIEDTSTGGIIVKNDGVGICRSAPSMPEIENKKVLFDFSQKFHEHEGHVVILKNFVMLALEE